MICEQARLEIGAAPDVSSPELDAHVAGCPTCRQFLAETGVLNDQIRRALQLSPPGLQAKSDWPGTISLPAPSTAGARRVARPMWRQGWAVAAAVLLSVLALVLFRPGASNTALANEIVAHLAQGDEAASWENTEIVPDGVLDRVLRDAGVVVDAGRTGKIVYAHTCVLRGHSVPHLVVQTSIGPLTVLPMVGESMPGEQAFSDDGLSGVLLPQQGGTIAVLARGPTDVRAVARELAQAIRFSR